ncbi:MAG: ATP-dependent zinc metalloprotease FtsH [Lachnospiraceae bacterium]
MILIITLVVAFLIVRGLQSLVSSQTTREVNYNEFLDELDAGNISDVKISTTRITYHLDNNSYIDYYTVYLNDPSLLAHLEAAGVDFRGVENDDTAATIVYLLAQLIPLVIFVVLLMQMMRQVGGKDGMMGMGRSNAKVFMDKDTGVRFSDVAGVDEAKESLTELVDFLHNPQKYAAIGAKLPKGALLVGAPGTGKTLLAKAIAGEAHVPFFSLAGSDFVEMFVGLGASRVRDLFKQASQNAPCIIFIDEIDAIGKVRDAGISGSNDEREQTLNQLLSEMDGFDPSKGVLVLGATNRPEILDPALLRPGRFDRRIVVDRPDLKGRIAILKVHAKDVRMDETVNFEELALATAGAVGADLANMINEAAITAVQRGRTAVSQKDLMDAMETVLVGKEKKDRVMSQKERKIVSYHEVGHALISALQKDAEPVQKITIVPRTQGALGYVLQTPQEERFLQSKEELLADITVALGGRAAEQLVFGSITTGAQNDIERATQVARQMITMYGMSDEFGMMALETVQSQYLSGRTQMNCSDSTAAKVDEAVRVLLADRYKIAYQMLSENREIMDDIAAFLIQRETITGKEFMDILHADQEKRKQKSAEEQKAAAEPASDAAAASDNTAASDKAEVSDKAAASDAGGTSGADGAETVPDSEKDDAAGPSGEAADEQKPET